MYRICIMVLKCLGLIWQFWNQILHWIWGNIIVQLQNDIDNYLFSIYLTKWDKDVNEYEVSHLTPFWICSISAQYGFKIHVRTSLLTKLSKRTTKIDPKCKESSLCYPNFRAGFGVDTKCLQNRPIWPPFTGTITTFVCRRRTISHIRKNAKYVTVHRVLLRPSTRETSPWPRL